MDTENFDLVANSLRYHILAMTHGVGSGHPTSCFSAVELAVMLFFRHLRFDTDKPQGQTNDRVIFSKGHASALLYAIYEAAGVISDKDLNQYRQYGSGLEGHPTFRFPYSEAAGGSLGQGLSIGAGQAWAIRKRFLNHNQPVLYQKHNQDIYQVEYDATIKLPFSIPRVFVFMGDGELSEGAVWEAVMWADKVKLTNLIAVVDINRFGQSDETMYGHNLDMYRSRFEAFGWGTIVIDGHNWSEIDAAYEKAICYKAGPSVILAKTIKGKGIPLWEDKNGWHNKMLPEDDFEKALVKFKPKDHVSAVIQKPELIDFHTSHATASNQPVTLSATVNDYPQDKTVATKLAFGRALVKIGRNAPDLIVLDGDVANSTQTDLFQKEFPDRFLEMYIAEQNMVGVAVGLSKRGYIPVVSTFAAFLTRASDQLRMAPLNDVTLIVNGSYGGVVTGRDGPSQFGLEDISLFRSVFGSTVLYPSDPYQAEKLTGLAFGQKGLTYIRTTREPTPIFYGPDIEVKIGGSHTHPSHINHPKNLTTIVAAGITLRESISAQKELEKQGIAVQVIDCYSIKPIDVETLVKAAAKSKAIITVEDHYPSGGLGEAVKSALSDVIIPVVSLAVTKLPMSGSPEELLKFEEIDAEAIIKVVKKLV